MVMLTLKEACVPEEVRGQEMLNDCPSLSQWTHGLELVAVAPGRPPIHLVEETVKIEAK